MKVDDLTGAKLDYWVARATGREMAIRSTGLVVRFLEGGPTDWRSFHPSSDWAQGGPIIECEGIHVYVHGGGWRAYRMRSMFGETPLIAAMRAYVESKFGRTVEDLPA